MKKCRTCKKFKETPEFPNDGGRLGYLGECIQCADKRDVANKSKPWNIKGWNPILNAVMP